MNRCTRWPVLMITFGALAVSACGGDSPPADGGSPPGDGGSPPGAPSVDAVPALTNQNPITITGEAEVGALVEVRGGAGSPSQTTAATDGIFSLEVMLTANALNVLVVSQAVGGLESQAAVVRVEHDGMAPDAPSLDPVVTPTRRATQRIRGSTEASATILVTGGAAAAEATADGSGRFEVEVELEASAIEAIENVLSVRARDRAGNVGVPATVSITFDPAVIVEAPLLDGFPAFTSRSTVTLAGDAEAGVGIRAVGGAADGSATVDADGRFTVEIGLRPNQRNEILVFAIAGGESSGAASAFIVHDDLAPEAPNVDPQASPTSAEIIVVGGEAEAGVSIAIRGGATDASGTADDAGRFAIDVTLSANVENVLSVIATDAAGNASEPATLSITHDSSLEEPIVVDPVRSPTSDPTLDLTGRASPGIDIEITGAEATVATSSDASGVWAATVALRANARNELRITRPGSGVDTIVVVVHDDRAPDAPTLNAVPSPTGSASITVSGSSEPLARVSVSGGTSPVAGDTEADGRFALAVTLAEDAESTLSVIATDRAGNSSSPATVLVRHSSSVPDAPIVNVPNPAPTNAATHTVTGRVVSPGPGIGIVVRGGSAEATASTDESTGVFSVEVSLNLEVVNALSVVSVTGTIESPPASVTITHDSIAPDAPDGARITATGTCIAGIPTGGTVAGSMGSVEARSSVRVLNVTRATSATTSATDGGSFTIGLPTCPGQVIRITATDAAGNVSDPLELIAS